MLILFDGEPGPTNTLKFVAEKLAVGLWTFDIQSNAMRWSSGMFHLLGHEPGTVEPSLELFSAAVHPSDRQKTCAYDAMIQGGVKMDREFRLVSPDGRMRWVCNRGEVIRDGAGQAHKAVGVVFDITRQQEARLSQRIAEDRYRALADALSAIVWAAPGDGRI